MKTKLCYIILYPTQNWSNLFLIVTEVIIKGQFYKNGNIKRSIIFFVKIVKKLAGNAGFTAAWATNVGNEFGQVLVSVLTAAEGNGLNNMAAGLVARYDKACVSP